VAAQALSAEQSPALAVRLADTHGLAMTHGFAVLAAARALAGGASVDEAAEAAESAGRSGRLAGMLGTMRYLARGGRVPWIVHWAAQALRIRPLLAFEDGRAHSVGRVRTETRGIERLLAYARAHADGRPLRLAVMHTEAPHLADRLAELACRELTPVELLRTRFTSVMAVHTGPGFVGLALCPDE
jgi:DegV family protein with EDD domain